MTRTKSPRMSHSPDGVPNQNHAPAEVKRAAPAEVKRAAPAEVKRSAPIAHLRRRRFAMVAMLGLATGLLGCQAVTRSPAARWGTGESASKSQPEIRQVSAESEETGVDQDLNPAGSAGSVATSSSFSPSGIVNWVRGRPAQDQDLAKEVYREGDALFRQAETLPREEAISVFAEAAKKFKLASHASPDSALGQDALFMLAESQFFADRMADAVDSYQTLQKEYPRSRHSDRSAARLFSISRYWIETEKASGGRWVPNFTDPKRPKLDPDGHAIRVLDQIRFDDPTGRLADDATMAAAAEFIRQRKFDQADEFLTDLRETYTDSEHLFHAHLLGIQCKLELYAGPQYSNLLLDEAEKLVRQTRTRFPDRLQEERYAEIVARASARISYHKAEKLFTRAQYRDKRHEYRAAAKYYQALLNSYGETPFAETARKRLTQISDRPGVPERHLAFLTKIFHSGKSSNPLELAVPETETSEGSMLR